MRNWKPQHIWIDLGPEVKSIRDVKLGMVGKILPSGRKPEGDYTMPDGSIWEFKNGLLTSIGDPNVKKGIIQFHSYRRVKQI